MVHHDETSRLKAFSDRRTVNAPSETRMPIPLCHDHLDNSASEPGLEEGVGKWNTAFNESNRGQYDRSFAQSLREHHVKRHLLDAFLQDTESTVPSLEVKQTKKILRNIRGQPRIHSQPARAWVESRRRATDHCPDPPKFRTPDQLSKYITDRVSFWFTSFSTFLSNLTFLSLVILSTLEMLFGY
jgi:hypothetical protein